MNVAILVRRSTVFVVAFLGGMSVVVWAAGSLFVENGGTTAPPAHADVPAAEIVSVDRGSGLGPGKNGRLDRDDVAIVDGRPIPFRELSAEWESSEPRSSREPGVRLLALTGARIVFYPRPESATPPAADERADGTTVVAGRTALLKQRENAPASARLEGGSSATHRLAAGESMVLRADTLDVRTEERGAGRAPVHVLETADDVMIESGGSEMTGRGLIAEFDTGRGAGARRAIRVEKNVRGKLHAGGGASGVRQKAGATASTPPETTLECSGSADIEAIDRPGRDGRQPWRSTFREDVRVDDGGSTMTADHVAVDFVRTGTADRAAGAESTEIRSLAATGQVRVNGRDGQGGFHLSCERLRRFAEDAVTDVTVLEGSPVLRFEGRSQTAAAGAPISTFEVRCTGPVRMRERRTAATRDAAGKDVVSNVTIEFTGDVVATERVAAGGDIRSEINAPRVTIECRRTPQGRLDPRVVRAEQGAEGRFLDVAVRAQTIVATAPDAPGRPQRIALTGSPIVSQAIAEGANPLGGAERAGRLLLSSDGRIDLELAPDPAPGVKPTGTRASAKVAGKMTVRKTVGDVESWRLTSQDGDARVGWDGAIEDLHANGDAVLSGRGGDDGKRRADLSGSRITLRRGAAGAGAGAGAAAAKADAWKQLDAFVESSAMNPAQAVVNEGGADGARTHRVRANELVYGEDGSVIRAHGAAHADMHQGSGGRPDSGAVTIDADDLRVDLDRDGDERATVRLLTATGSVRLDGAHKLFGERVVYKPLQGEAEATGRPARIVRTDESYASGPLIRAWFNPKATGGDRFLRASLPLGGEIVAYHVAPARQRVTTTCKGPLDLTRTTAAAVRQVVSVYESRRTDGGWNSDSRIDCERLDLTFDQTGAEGASSDRIRSMIATGTPDSPARIHSNNPGGDREAIAEAERIEAKRESALLFLTCPSDLTSVYLHDVAAGRRVRCDAATFNYVTYEWITERPREVE
ncbi:MAG: hypothetical protein K8T90_16630 [Planctomycetes bacterium]|nr:hypothetical protein [Planctomycetota bacterium]